MRRREKESIKLSLFYKVLAPRPVVLISTVSPHGISNAAPFSFVMPVSVDPPMVAFASAPDHDTVKNIIKVKDFVVNLPDKTIIDKLWKSSEHFPYEVSEFEQAGFTEERSKKVKAPCVRECYACFECKLFGRYRAGDHLLIIGRVVRAEVEKGFFQDERFLIDKAEGLMHIGGKQFCLAGRKISPG